MRNIKLTIFSQNSETKELEPIQSIEGKIKDLPLEFGGVLEVEHKTGVYKTGVISGIKSKSFFSDDSFFYKILQLI